jgi:hypothetical protein
MYLVVDTRDAFMVVLKTSNRWRRVTPIDRNYLELIASFPRLLVLQVPSLPRSSALSCAPLVKTQLKLN